jgi:hypothetical protein
MPKGLTSGTVHLLLGIVLVEAYVGTPSSLIPHLRERCGGYSSNAHLACPTALITRLSYVQQRASDRYSCFILSIPL